jgi:hypothetical protein
LVRYPKDAVTLRFSGRLCYMGCDDANRRHDSRHDRQYLRPRQHVNGCTRFLPGLRVASISRRRALMQLALMGGGLALAASGCGFLALVFEGEDRQTIRQEGICDDLASEFSSEVPALVELRTDKTGTTRYRALRLGGTDVDPQWVPMPDQHADATGWVKAGNFTKMDFQHKTGARLLGSIGFVRRFVPRGRRPVPAQRRCTTYVRIWRPSSWKQLKQ